MSNILWTVTVILFSISGAIAQSVNPISRLDIQIRFEGDTVYYDIEDSLSTYVNDTVALSLVFQTPPTFTQGSIHVKLGSSEGLDDLFSSELTFDGQSTYPTGATYRKVGNINYVGLGVYADVAKYCATVQLEDSNSQLSPTISTCSR